MRKFIALAATALLLAVATPNVASARMGGGGHMGGGHMGGGHMGMGGGHFASVGGGWHGNWGGGRFASHRAFFRDHDRGRFAFRHHRFRHFRDGLFFAGIDDDYGCFAARRVWTPWGWRWRRIWVCG